MGSDSLIYADTDFFLALLKESDWLKGAARGLLDEFRGKIWTSPTTLIELLLVAKQYHLDPERLLIDVLELAHLEGGQAGPYLLAANYLNEHKISVFDSIHAAFCGKGKIISSDKVFDKLGLDRIRLKP